eukprot:symbB.v1.2.036105.t1/scaffold5010.1/size60825/7
MALFPSWGDLASFARVTQALEFFHVEDDVWQAFVHQVGEVREDMRLLAALSRPAVLAGCSSAVLPDGSPLNALQATQVGLVWRLARRVMAHLGGTRESEFVDVEVWLDNPPNSSESSTRTTVASGSAGATNTVKEKVLKMSNLIDQADDSELLPPSNSELNKWHQNYVAIMGAQADESEEPSPNQLAALFKRVFINDHPPYCDFGVWLPFERKMSKAHRFRVFTPLGDGSFLQKDLPGPASFQAWMASWRVFKTACLMLNIATLSSLETYSRHIEKLVLQWPSAWGLVASADDQARAEKMSRLRRSILLDQSVGRQIPRDWDPGAPWSCVLVELTKDVTYWNEKVHIPAAAWLAAGGKGAPVVASESAVMAVLPGSVNVETVEKEPDVSRKKQANRERRLAKRKRIQEEREELRVIKAGQSAKGGSKGKSKSKDQAGKPLCFSWASGSGVCVYGSSGSLELARWVVGTVMASQLEQDHEDLPAADYERDSPKMEDSKEVNLNDAPSDDVESKKSVTEFEEGPMVPKRVRLALEEAKDFEDYRRLREFRFLHMYSGPVDVLSKEVEAEAAKQRLRVKCTGLDKKVDDIDLATVRSHTVLRDEVRDGEWDATHAGFPCGSFSRVRHNAAPGMPGPVRDGQNIYGLETNTVQQQDEADKGTMMATQAAWIMEEQVNSCKRRKVPPAATLENPPGDQRCGSAWQLPEIRIVMDSTKASVAQYNTCAFQSKSKVLYGSSGSLELARWVVGTVMASQLEQDHEDLPAADYERDSPKMEDSKEVNLNDAPSDDVESKKSVTEFEEGPMVPKRVRLALEEAKDFEDYRRLREFRFLHMYSGPVDTLSKEVEAEAAKQRLRVKCTGLDKKVDDIDLATVRSHTVLRDEVRDGEWDATHAGFPCGSFSRVRHNAAPGMPGPVRDGQNIYGLETNTVQQQDEADKGTMMATQAAWIMEEQVNASVVKLQWPSTTHVHSNPSPKYVGINQGNLCRTSHWWENNVLKLRVYPVELANIIAKNIVATWKRTLSLEFWRHRLAVKQDEVSELQKKWVVNEEKRTRNLGQKRTIHMAVERGEPMVDELPSSSTHPSKKQRKEENFRSLGGMRNPTVTVSRMHLARLVGQRMRTEWIRFVAQHPTAIEVAEMYGSNEAKFDMTVMEAWKEKLGVLLKVDELESGGLILKENFAFKSPLDADLWDAWGRETRDPDDALPGFIRRGAPLGMELDIPSSNGIFPAVDDTGDETGEPETEFEAIKGLLNYKSVQEQPEEAKLEIDRNIAKGFVVRMTWDEVERRFGKGTCSRMALLLKEKPDGTTKRRIILDMRRSGGNSRAKVRERIILPRLGDVVDMVKNLKSRESELFEQLQQPAEWIRLSSAI